MNKRVQILVIIFSSLLLLIQAGCKKDDNPVNPGLQNESEVLAKYVEANGNYINSADFPALISAEQIRQNQLNNVKQIVLDLRCALEFERGHIAGAVQINASDIPAYYKSHNLQQMDKVVVTCLTGLSAGYITSLLRLQGFNNVYGMIWGMTSWNKDFDYWSAYIGDNYAAQFEKVPHDKNPQGSLPVLSTGKTSGADILSARVDELLKSGFDNVEISNEAVFQSLNKYYIINYASMESYLGGSGHIPGAVQYTPVADFNLSTNLKTLPADKPVVLYCGSGHGSTQMAAYLKLLGYNAKVILYGNNGMNYSTLNSGKKFSPTEIHDYPYVQGAQ